MTMAENEETPNTDGPDRFKGLYPQQWRQAHRAVAPHWEVLPPQAKDFLLAAPDGFLGLRELVGFWSAFPGIEDNPKRIMWSSLYLSLNYLRHDMIAQARALVINSVFFHQLCESPFQRIKELCETNAPVEVLEEELPFFVGGLRAAQSPDRMQPYIECYLPDDYVQLLTPHSDPSERAHTMRSYIDQISDGWEGPRKGSKRKPQKGADAGTPIKLIFVDAANEQAWRFDIGTRSTLKALFNKYADEKGVSLRSLRFSHAGKMLFLSTAGNKTPEQLGMHDQSVINVHDTRLPEENPQEKEAPASKKGGSKKSNKKNKKQRKGKKGKQIRVMQPVVVGKTEEEFKIEHSKMLDVLHAELQPRLKQIRQRLNNLTIKRRQPKVRSACRNSRTATADLSQTVVYNPQQDLSSKAGKSHFVVHVGEVANLHKPMKSMGISSRCGTPQLDLHGLTREDALERLNESLEGWVDVAMRGSYPFVTRVVIVCGGGNQVLRETVEGWIRSKNNVSNAPKR